MFTKQTHLESIYSTGAFLILRLNDQEETYQVAKAAIAGGMRALEVTYSVPGTLDIVSRLSKEHPDVLIGVGTVMDAPSAFAAYQAGARLIVSPHFNPELITVGNRYQCVVASGAFTPSEMVATAEAGADIVKLFPAEVVGPAYLKAVMAPLAHLPIAPTGAVNPDTVADWFGAGACAVGVGRYVSGAHRASGNFDDVSVATQTLLSAIAKARQS